MYLVNVNDEEYDVTTLAEAQAICQAYLEGVTDKDPSAHGLRITEDTSGGGEVEVAPYREDWYEHTRTDPFTVEPSGDMNGNLSGGITTTEEEIEPTEEEA